MTEQSHWSDGRRSATTRAGAGPSAGAVVASAGNGHAGVPGAGHDASVSDVVDDVGRLDAAMQRADELLVDSLRREEGRRRRRRRGIVLLITGAFIMTAIVCILLALLAGQDGKSSPDAERAQALSTEGWKLWQERKMSDAEAKFTEAVKLDAKNTEAWNGLGWSRFNQGKAKEAIEPFEKVIALEPEHPAALNGLGQVYLHQGKLEEAEKALLKAAANNASAAYFGLARLYLIKNDFDRALPWALLLVKEPGADEVAAQMLSAARSRKIDDALKRQLAPAKK